MRAALRYFVTKQPIAFGICVAALAFTLYFGLTLLLHVIWINDPRNRDPELEPWMRPRFVAMAYRIPPDLLAETLGLELPKGPGRPKERVTMEDVAADQGVDLETLTARVAAAAAAHHAERQK